MMWETLIWGIPFMIVFGAGFGLGLMASSLFKEESKASRADERSTLSGKRGSAWSRRRPDLPDKPL
jgi:hypothetical protein